MKKHPLLIHLAWALIAAGAWWLGSRRGESGEATPGELRSRLTATMDPVRGSVAAVNGNASHTAGGTVEVTSWLQKWAGSNGTLSAESMAAAVAEALHDPDSVRGLRHFTHLLACLSTENALAAVETLKANAGAANSGAWLTLLCSAWGVQDGAGALAGLVVREHREAALSAWARTDPAAAQQFVARQAQLEDSELPSLQRSLVRGLAQSDPGAAVQYIADQSGGTRGELTGVLTGEQFARGAPAAARWAAELSDSGMRGTALETVARHYMKTDPASGAAWAAETSSAPDMRQAVGRVADRLADDDVLAALKWTRQLPASPGQEEAYQQVFSEWARKDPAASSQELLRMPAGHERDNAIHSFAGSLVRENPDDAMVWATAISDPALRLNTQIDVARKWNANAPAAAQTWIAANLPPDARLQALTPRK